MLHHNRNYIEAVDADRRAAAARRRPPVEAGELEQLVLAATAGDGWAWSALIERFAARVRTVARAHRLQAHDVEDVVQTTWLRLLEHIESVREPTALGAWLETTGRRESLRVIRARQRESPTDNEHLIDEPVEPVNEERLVAAERRAAQAERRVALAKALERLPVRQQAVVSMLFADTPPSYGTISSSLDLPIGSIGPTRGRALARLRRDRGLMRAAEQVD